MANAMAIFAASRGMQAGQAFTDAYKQKLFAELQADAIDNQIDEISRRADIEIGNIFERAEQVTAEQTSAFVMGGVELEGSAMDVLADTMGNAAEAAYIRQREADYQIEGLAMQGAILDEQASMSNFIFNVAAGGANAYAGALQDEFMVNRMSLRNRGVR